MIHAISKMLREGESLLYSGELLISGPKLRGGNEHENCIWEDYPYVCDRPRGHKDRRGRREAPRCTAPGRVYGGLDSCAEISSVVWEKPARRLSKHAGALH